MSDITLLEMRTDFGEFIHLFADREMNGHPELFIERLLPVRGQLDGRFDHLDHAYKSPLEQSEVVLNAALACEQLRKLVCLLGVGEHDFNDLGRFVDFGLHNYPSYRCIVPNSIQVYTASLL